MTAVRSSLAPWQGEAPADPAQLERLRRSAFRTAGIIVVRPSDRLPQELRRGIEDWARRELGAG